MQETISQKIERAAKGFTGDMGEITSCCEKLQKQVAMLEANLHADVAGVELRLARVMDGSGGHAVVHRPDVAPLAGHRERVAGSAARAVARAGLVVA